MLPPFTKNNLYGLLPLALPSSSIVFTALSIIVFLYSNQYKHVHSTDFKSYKQRANSCWRRGELSKSKPTRTEHGNIELHFRLVMYTIVLDEDQTLVYITGFNIQVANWCDNLIHKNKRELHIFVDVIIISHFILSDLQKQVSLKQA